MPAGYTLLRHEYATLLPKLHTRASWGRLYATKARVRYAFVNAAYSRQLGMNQEVMKQINELQSLKDEDQQHILKTMGALIREAKTRLTFR